jgi:hypothetical protein
MYDRAVWYNSDILEVHSTSILKVEEEGKESRQSMEKKYIGLVRGRIPSKQNEAKGTGKEWRPFHSVSYFGNLHIRTS